MDEPQIDANLPLPPRCNPMTTPKVPNPWAQPRSLGNQERKRKARQEAIVDETKKQLNEILGEYDNPPFPSPTFERGFCNDPPVSTFDWPNNPIKHIQGVMQTPGNMPTAPEFNFKLSGEAAKCNMPTAPEFNFELSGEAAKHYNGNTPTAPEFNFELSSEATKCNMPIAPEFKFELSGEAAKHNNPSPTFKKSIRNDPPFSTFDWPNDLIEQIREVMQTPCNTPTAPEFNFELSNEAAKHNKAILSKYKSDLG